MTATVSFGVHERQAMLPLRQFTTQFANVLPGLIRLMRSEELRRHPKWGRQMPYQVPAYSGDASVGHICRPDIIMTSEGPRITEIDFVPSGRGWALAGIPTVQGRRAHLGAYQQWYASMGFGAQGKPVYYATGSTTVCREEADLFAHAMQRMGVLVKSVNVDTDPLEPSGLVDRLFYRAELARPLRLGRSRIITAEPWFDSKMIFAVVHDPAMTNALVKYVGRQGLAFLRQVLIPTYLLEDLVRDDHRMPRTHPSLRLRRDIIENRQKWVIKSTEVEESWSWGARSVVLGNRTGQQVWEGAVRFANGSPARKILGHHPIVQVFSQSLDFRDMWNAATTGDLAMPDPARFGKPTDAATGQKARRVVFARAGVFFLIDNRSGRVFTPPQGVLTLRQDPLAHGASDAIITAFGIA